MPPQILIIDDSKTVRALARAALLALDCEVIEAGNGVQGLIAARRQIPDFILLDVTMPIMDGARVLSRLRADADLRSVPVLLLVGDNDELAAEQLGVPHRIHKPFTYWQLLDCMQRLLAPPVAVAG